MHYRLMSVLVSYYYYQTIIGSLCISYRPLIYLKTTFKIDIGTLIDKAQFDATQGTYESNAAQRDSSD